jgi:hypothetical protein
MITNKNSDHENTMNSHKKIKKKKQHSLLSQRNQHPKEEGNTADIIGTGFFSS